MRILYQNKNNCNKLTGDKGKINKKYYENSLFDLKIVITFEA